jgi:cytidine deaminase
LPLQDNRLTRITGAGVCAERATVCHTINHGYKIKAIAITSDLKEEFITPCGICRQFIREFGKDIEIYMFKGDDWMVKTLEEVLPLSFGPEQLH